MSSASSPQPIGEPAEPGFEQAMAELEAIIARIESGEVGLEESIRQYERGVGLVNRCREILAGAEQRVVDLTARMHAEGPQGPGSGPDAAPGDPRNPAGARRR